MTTTIQQPEEATVVVPTCIGCGKQSWSYNVTYSTRFNLISGQKGARMQSKEEIRCANCGRKAVTDIANAVRETKLFGLISLNEDAHR